MMNCPDLSPKHVHSQSPKNAEHVQSTCVVDTITCIMHTGMQLQLLQLHLNAYHGDQSSSYQVLDISVISNG